MDRPATADIIKAVSLSPRVKPNLTIEEMFRLTTRQTEDFALQEYSVRKKSVVQTPRNCRILEKHYDPNNWLQIAYKRGNQTPSPSKYNTRPGWQRNDGGFTRSPRKTETERIFKNKNKTPSPASYRDKRIKRVPLGKLGRAKSPSIFGDKEFLASETPGAGKYNPNHNATDIRPGTATYKWTQPKKAKKTKSSMVGPGTYDDANQQYLRLKASPRRTIMMKDTGRDGYNSTIKYDKNPGVGAYNLDSSLKLYKGPPSRGGSRR